MRTIIWFIYFWLYLLFAEPAYWHLRRLDKQGKTAEHDAKLRKIVQKWSRRLIALAGGDVTVNGLENMPKKPAVYVSNHLSYYDIPMVLGYLGDDAKPMLAKKQITKIPGINRWMRELHCVFVDRDNPREGILSIKEAAEWVKKGYSMVVFPEGTRSRDGKVHEFKQGAFHIAKYAGNVPVVPVVMENTQAIMKPGSIWMHPAKVSLTVLPPIDTTGYKRTDWKALPEKTRVLIEDYQQKH